MTISEKIYKLRTDSGLSQKEFADKAGTSQSAINYWENGKRQPRTSQLKKIAKTFDIPLYTLIDDNYSVWDISNEANKKRARFVGDTEMVKPLRFTAPSNNEYTMPANIDRDNPLNIALKKLDDDVQLTLEERNLVKAFLQSSIFREQMALLPAKFKELADVLRQNYELLNSEGKQQADEQIDRTAEHIKLLTRIPEFCNKRNDTK